MIDGEADDKANATYCGARELASANTRKKDMIPFQLHRRLPLIRRPFYQRDQARAEASRLRQELLQERTSTAQIQSLQAQIQQLQDELGRSALTGYVTAPPSYAEAFRVFDGMWSSHVPGYGGGSARLFEDHRLKFFEHQCGGFAGKRVLELGPLEGAHTYMLARGGAANITAIEANRSSFLKCLIVQNALKFDADFILGDFRLFLEVCTESYDLIVASGVLYHMTEPWALLYDITRCAQAIGIWTHYYDGAVIAARDNINVRFTAEPVTQRLSGREIRAHRFNYLDAVSWGGFCGGAARHSYWLERDDIIGLLKDAGFRVEISDDDPNHPNGPAMTLFAERLA